jgi:flagellar hook assembly protein FlgD
MTFSLTPTGRPSINVRAWPRPWKPGSGASHDALGITVSGPPDNSVIRIYTVAGELVKELTVAPADLNLKVWDGKNSAGRNAASGVYFAHIKAPGYEAQILKLAIER